MKIHKFIFLIFTFFIFISITNAEVAEIKLGDRVEGVKLHIKTDTIEKNKNMYQIINSTNGNLVYCIEPGVLLKDGTFNEYHNPGEINIKMSEEEWQTVQKIAYFGYGYQDHTDIKWYAATQFMIWDYLLKDRGEIYFLDDNNQKINLYTNEINAIQKELNNYPSMPSFSGVSVPTYHTKINEELVLEDKNNILNQITITNDQELSYEIKDNNLKITPNKFGHYYLNFKKEFSLGTSPKIYYNGDSQTVMDRGDINSLYTSLFVIVDYPSLKITKKASEPTYFSLEGAEYNIYNIDNSFYSSLKTNKDGVMTMSEIIPGEYYLEETKAPYGYKVNKEKIYFTVENQDINLEIKEDLIKKTINIEKYLAHHNNTFSIEPDAKFQILNKDYPEYEYFITTNKYGKATINLPYGNYLIKQISGKSGYNLMKNQELIVDENYNEASSIVINNSEITGKIHIEKRDYATKELILAKAIFKIKNNETGLYLIKNNKDIFETINGVLELSNIPYGKYILEEVSAPPNYKILDKNIEFQIIENDKTINLEVLNKLSEGTLQINKIDKQTGKPLSDVLFGLYNPENILLKEIYTNEKGEINLTLPVGEYYLKELKSPADYELNNDIIPVSIKDNIKSFITITNRLRVDVPPTGAKRELATLLISAIILLIGVIICKYGKKFPQDK